MKPPSPQERHRRTAVDLLGEKWQNEGIIRLQVSGESMAPLLRPEEHVIAAPVPAGDLRRGDLVVVRRQGVLVTHRLAAHSVGDGWYTKGDNSLGVDPLVPADAILGRVVALEVLGGLLDTSGWRWTILNRILGWIGGCQTAVLGAAGQLETWDSTAAQDGLLPTRGGFRRLVSWTARWVVVPLLRRLTRIINRYTRWRFRPTGS